MQGEDDKFNMPSHPLSPPLPSLLLCKNVYPTPALSLPGDPERAIELGGDIVLPILPPCSTDSGLHVNKAFPTMRTKTSRLGAEIVWKGNWTDRLSEWLGNSTGWAAIMSSFKSLFQKAHPTTNKSHLVTVKGSQTGSRKLNTNQVI